jgi:hypothetical protein
VLSEYRTPARHFWLEFRGGDILVVSKVPKPGSRRLGFPPPEAPGRLMNERTQIFGDGRYVFLAWRSASDSNSAFVLADSGGLNFRPYVDLRDASDKYFRQNKIVCPYNFLTLTEAVGTVLLLRYVGANDPATRVRPKWQCRFDVARRRFSDFKPVT